MAGKVLNIKVGSPLSVTCATGTMASTLHYLSLAKTLVAIPKI